MTPHWLRRIGARLLWYWPLKASGTCGFMVLFFWAYFYILHHPQSQPTVMPAIWLDQWIAFTPYAFAVYVSLWVYVSLVPALLGNLRAMVLFCLWMSAMCLFCLAMFWLFPTQTPDFGIDWRLYPTLGLIKGVDAAGNACPSLHVASAIFSAFWLERILSQLQVPAALRVLNWVHCVAIAWSTIATLQHVALDVFAGIAVGVVFAIASLWQVPKTG